MRILVTGGAGFIGSHVVDAFIAAGHHVAVVDSLASGRRENLNPRATFYEVDVRDAELLADVFAAERPEVVDHHAAQVEVRRSIEDPVYDAQVNVLGTLNVLEQARLAGARKVIYISSGGAVYGEPVRLPCDEEHPIAPLCPYGASKYAMEVYLRVYRATYGLETTVLRYANVYGPRQDPHGEAGVVAIFAGRMLNAEGGPQGTGLPVPRINGDGEQTRDFVYVGDCARANVLALDVGDGGVYNVGTGAETSINELASKLVAVTGYTGEVTHGPANAGEVIRIYSAVERAREGLGFEAAVPLTEGLARTVAFFAEQQELS